jgi:hypothetical protein
MSISTGSPSRFTRKFRCPVCGGADDDADARCLGYLSTDRKFAHCSRVPVPGQEPTPPLFFLERKKAEREKAKS